MTTPWLEIDEYQDMVSPTSQAYPETAWQALFACQVEVFPHQEWAKRKWGFNAAALFEEAMERQKLFLESQYGYPDEFGMEPRDNRTLAFRFIKRPAEGLLIAIVGKIQARTRDEVRDCALSYYREVKATFPYDYVLHPACSQHEFYIFSGKDIIEEGESPFSVTQIKRMELPVNPRSNLLYLQGLWRSGPRAYEQIWRSLGASPSPLFLNISLRSTLLYEDEQEGYIQSLNDFSNLKDLQLDEVIGSTLQQWNKDLVERRLAPWKKFFYLQVHLVSTKKLSDHLFRTIGTSLTLNNKGGPLPGYQVTFPRPGETQSWRAKIKNLDFILTNSFLSSPRFSEIADLDEVFDVMHLPYSPPENGFPDLEFYTTRSK